MYPMLSRHGAGEPAVILLLVCSGLAGAAPASELTEFCKALLASETQNLPSADPKEIQDCGNAALARNEYQGAVRVFELAIRAAERSQDKAALARGRHGAGKARFRLGDLAKAETLLLDALKGFEALGLKADIASAMLDLARLRIDQSRYRESLELALQSLR